jgi:hypothetical protein
MAGQELKIRIVGDATGASAVLVGTTDQIKSMKQQLDETAGAGVKMGEKLAEGGKTADYSMLQARHSVMLLGEGVGVHIPRAVSTMLASIGPVGGLLAAAFPILAVVALVGIIVKIAEHFQKAAEEAQKFAIEEQNVADKSALITQALELTNLKLQDQIAKLEGGAGKNALREQLLEANKAAGDLAANLTKDNVEAAKLLKDTGFWATLGAAFSSLNPDLIEVGINIKKVDGATAAAEVAWKRLQAAQAAMDITPSVENQKALAAALLATQTVFQQSVGVIREYGAGIGGAAAKADWLTKKILEFSGAQKDLGLIQQHADLDQQLKADERAKTAKTFAEEQIKDAARVAEAWLGVSEAKAKEAPTTLLNIDEQIASENELANQKLDIVKAEAAAGLALHKGGSDADKSARESLNTQLEVAEAAHQQRLEAIIAEFSKRRTELEKKAAEEVLKAAEKLEKSREELAKSGEELAVAQGKVTEAQAKSSMDAQLNAIKMRVAAGLQTEKSANAEMAGLYAQDAKVKIGVEEGVIALLKAEEDDAALNLIAAMATVNQAEINSNQVKINKILAQEQAAAAKIIEIRTALANQISVLNIKTETAEEKVWKSTLDKMNSEFGNFAANVIMGHETIGQAAMKLYDQMATTFIKNMVMMMMKQLEGHLFKKALDKDDQFSAAKTGAADAWKAMAGIPIVGPVLGAVAAATVFAGIMAFDEGGISRGGLALLHPQEAVLTPMQTENLQRAADTGGMGAGGGEMHTHFHISAIDAGGVQSFFKKHGSAMADAWHAQVRQGSINLAQAYRGK